MSKIYDAVGNRISKTLRCSECGEDFDFDSHEHICRLILRDEEGGSSKWKNKN